MKMKNVKLGLVLKECELIILIDALRVYREHYGNTLMQRDLSRKLDILSGLNKENNETIKKIKNQLIEDNKNRIDYDWYIADEHGEGMNCTMFRVEE